MFSTVDGDVCLKELLSALVLIDQTPTSQATGCTIREIAGSLWQRYCLDIFIQGSFGSQLGKVEGEAEQLVDYNYFIRRNNNIAPSVCVALNRGNKVKHRSLLGGVYSLEQGKGTNRKRVTGRRRQGKEGRIRHGHRSDKSV